MCLVFQKWVYIFIYIINTHFIAPPPRCFQAHLLFMDFL